MAFTHTLTKQIQTPEGTVSQAVAVTGSSVVAIDEAVANSATNFQINVAIDVSALKSIYIVSDQAVTMETNSGSSPNETLNLLAGVPYEWQAGGYFTNLLETDITAVFITNASGATANVSLRALLDATP